MCVCVCVCVCVSVSVCVFPKSMFNVLLNVYVPWEEGKRGMEGGRGE